MESITDSLSYTTISAPISGVMDLESIAFKYPEVRSMYTTVGKDKVLIFIKLSDKKERKDSAGDIAEKMRNDYEKIPGIEFAINTASMGPDAAKDVTFNIRGND